MMTESSPQNKMPTVSRLCASRASGAIDNWILYIYAITTCRDKAPLTPNKKNNHRQCIIQHHVHQGIKDHPILSREGYDSTNRLNKSQLLFMLIREINDKASTLAKDIYLSNRE